MKNQPHGSGVFYNHECNSCVRTNLRAIAQAAGVNVATVSRALRGLSSVNDKTCERIQKIARELGYVRDPLLANALTYARKQDKPTYRETVAFVFSVPHEEYLKLPWLLGMHEGMKKRGAELGYKVELVRMPEMQRAQRSLARQLEARGIRGYAICPVNPVLERSTLQLDPSWNNFIGVEIDHALVSPELPRVSRDFMDDINRMLEQLYLRGYRRLGIAIRTLDEESRHWATLSGCLLFQFFHPDVRLSFFFKDHEEFSAMGIMRWIKRRKPDVLIANGPEVYDWLLEKKVKVPEEIGVVRIALTRSIPNESGLHLNFEDMGITAIEFLSLLIERHDMGISKILKQSPTMCLRGYWNEGNTLRPLTDSAKKQLLQSMRMIRSKNEYP